MHNDKNVAHDLLKLKKEIKTKHQAVVTFIPIPPVILDISQTYKLYKAVIDSPKFSQAELQRLQSKHTAAIIYLNRKLQYWNREQQ